MRNGGTTKRLVALLLAFALATGGLVAGGGATTASATSSEPTLAGSFDEFVSGSSFSVAGTDPNGIGGTVQLLLEGEPAGSATVQPDGSWATTVDISGLPDGRYGLMAEVSGTSKFKYVWVQNDTTSLELVSPAAGSTVTTTTDGCIPVTARLAASGVTWQAGESYAWIRVGPGASSALVDVDGDDLVACLPASTVPNGAATVWVSLKADDRSYLARIDVTLALTTVTTPSVTVGTDGIVIRGSITHPAPDTEITARLDGGAPIPVFIPQQSDPYGTTTWTMGATFPVWQGAYSADPYPVRKTADGPHEVTLSVTSRGTTTQLGPYAVEVDGTGRLEIDSSDASVPTQVTVSGTLDNIDPGTDPDYNLRADVYRGGTLYTSSITPTYTWASPKQYGQDRWSFTLFTGPDDGTPVLVKVAAYARNLDVVCDAVNVTGRTTSAATCGATAPGVPTGLRATSSSATAASLTVTPPANTGGAPITGYTASFVQWGQSFPVTTVNSTGTTIPLSGLTPFNTQVWVKARNATGSSYASEPYSVYSSSLTCSKPASSLAVGKSVTLTCLYDNGLREVQVSPPPVTLSVQAIKPRGTTWTTVATKSAPLANNVTITVPLSLTGTWSLRVVAGSFQAPAGYPAGVVRPATTATTKTSVTGPAPKLTLKLSSSTVRYGSTVTFSGTSSPWYAGQKVYLQRYSSGAWRTITSRSLTTSAYKIAYKPTTRTDYRWRVWTPAAYGRPAGASASVLLTVQ